MDLTPEERDRLDDYRQMMGDDAGGLAFALDQLTDVMALVGQHTVYCRIEKGPHAGEASLDLTEALGALQKTKTLVQQTRMELREKGEGGAE